MLIVKSIEDIDSNAFKDFSCGNADLDTYLKTFARQNHKKGIGNSYVALDGNRAIGYFTISMSSIEFFEIPQEHHRGIPKYPSPVAKIGRLAVDKEYQGKKIGTALLIEALKKIREASKIVAAYAVVVDAKNEAVKKFYLSFWFTEYKNELSLFLPMKTIDRLLS
ncbi:MAG: GNAT family N-acetyltransferase [Parachlamydia sp.]|nr:GNAT family N-acetyltransferase [Parachlamydia sp.]